MSLLVYQILSCKGGFVIQSNGEAALVLVGQHPLDLLITDFDMGPGMKGDELSREVRKKFSSLRIIMVTGSEVPASYPHPSMQKGVRREDFIAEVKYWLNN